MKRLIVIAALLGGCQPLQPPSGPASLQIVPADYYSVRAGPSGGRTTPAKGAPPAQPAAPSLPLIPPDVKATIERMNDRARDIRGAVDQVQ